MTRQSTIVPAARLLVNDAGITASARRPDVTDVEVENTCVHVEDECSLYWKTPSS